MGAVFPERTSVARLAGHRARIGGTHQPRPFKVRTWPPAPYCTIDARWCKMHHLDPRRQRHVLFGRSLPQRGSSDATSLPLSGHPHLTCWRPLRTSAAPAAPSVAAWGPPPQLLPLSLLLLLLLLLVLLVLLLLLLLVLLLLLLLLRRRPRLLLRCCCCCCCCCCNCCARPRPCGESPAAPAALPPWAACTSEAECRRRVQGGEEKRVARDTRGVHAASP